MAISKELRKELAKLGRKGGKQRVANQTPEQRRASAAHANKARWDKVRAASKQSPEAAA